MQSVTVMSSQANSRPSTFLAGLDGHIVVAHVNDALGDQHVPAAAGINARRCWPREAAPEDGHALDHHVVAIRRHEMELGRVLQRDARDHSHILAVSQHDHRTRQRVTRSSFGALLRGPPVFAGAVNDAFAGDRNVGELLPPMNE